MTTWRWIAGMRYIRPQYSHHHRVSEWEIENGYTFDEDCTPDWEDPATLGCLLYQVREARGEPWYSPTSLLLHGDERVWIIEHPCQKRQTRYRSEAAVLLAALKEMS